MIHVYVTGLCNDIMLSHFLTGSNWHAGLRSAHGANRVGPGLISDWKSQNSMGFQTGREPALFLGITRFLSISWSGFGFETSGKNMKKRKNQIRTEALVATNGVSLSIYQTKASLTPTSRIIRRMPHNPTTFAKKRCCTMLGSRM